MFHKDCLQRFSIRKFSVGVASAVIGLMLLASPTVPTASADTLEGVSNQRQITFKYVTEKQLTSDQRQQLQHQIDKNTVGNYQTYYMVYRPQTSAKQLPPLGNFSDWYLGGAGCLFLIGLATVKGKKKKLIVSMILLTSFASIPVSAIEVSPLAKYDRQMTLKVGDRLSDMAFDIEGYTFLGYLPSDELTLIASNSSSVTNLQKPQSSSLQVDVKDAQLAANASTKVPIVDLDDTGKPADLPVDVGTDNPVGTPTEGGTSTPVGTPTNSDADSSDSTGKPEELPVEAGADNPVGTPTEGGTSTPTALTTADDTGSLDNTDNSADLPVDVGTDNPVGTPTEATNTPTAPTTEGDTGNSDNTDNSEDLPVDVGTDNPVGTPTEGGTSTPTAPTTEGDTGSLDNTDNSEDLSVDVGTDNPAGTPTEGGTSTPTAPTTEGDTGSSDNTGKPEDLPVGTILDNQDSMVSPKQLPMVKFHAVTADISKLKASVLVDCDDPDHILKNIAIAVYEDNRLIENYTVNSATTLTFDIPAYDKTYRLLPSYTYVIDNKDVTISLDEQNILLPMKRLATPTLLQPTLYHIEDGKLKAVENSSLQPADLTNYMIKAQSKNGQEWWLPVVSITEENGNYQVVTQVGEDDALPTTFTLSKAEKQRTRRSVTTEEVDYQSFALAKEGYDTAYHNVSKFLPFYDTPLIIYYANQLQKTDKLYTTPVLSVVPLVTKNQQLVVAPNSAKASHLLLSFADGTVDFVNLDYLGQYQSTGIQEYRLKEFPLLYTPSQRLESETIVKPVLSDFKAVSYQDGQLLKHLNRQYTSDNYRDTYLAQLYLERQFGIVQQNIEEELVKILENSIVMPKAIPALMNYYSQYLKENKEQILLSLSYLKRWYGIPLQQITLSDLLVYHPDFYGQDGNALALLTTFGKGDYNAFLPSDHLATYTKYLKDVTQVTDFFDYLTDSRVKFTAYDNDDDWFAATTKAYIVEEPSQVGMPMQRLYTRLKSDKTQKTDILPLLTAEEGIFILNTPLTITFGMYDRYMKMNTKQTNPQEYEKSLRGVEAMADRAAREQRIYQDVWYRILPEKDKEKLLKTVAVYDGYMVNGKWLSRYDNSNHAIRDFFGPMGIHSTANYLFAEAFALNQKIVFVIGRVLTDYGTAVYTHEMAHIYDKIAFLAGYDRRPGMGPESYADGLFMSGTRSSYFADALTLNFAFDYTKHKEATNRFVNQSPERFQTGKDVQEYLQRLFDVMYVLDYYEAKHVLEKGDKVVKEWYGMLEGKTSSKWSDNYIDVLRAFTKEELERIKTVEDLIDYNAMSRKGLFFGIKYGRNGYYTVPLFNANFAAPMNAKGAPGGLTFRRIGFELWAEKGYENGFVPFASNQLLPYAPPHSPLTDSVISSQIFAEDSYKDWHGFKKAMLKKRVDQLPYLKPVTFKFDGATFTNADAKKIEELMEHAVTNDARYPRSLIAGGYSSRVHKLKMAIFNAYLRQTDDFKTSIFAEKSSHVNESLESIND